MPTDVSCPDPDPNEVVTRRILAEELTRFRQEFRLEMATELASHGRAIAEANRQELARQARAIEETILEQMNALFEAHSPKKQLDDHEVRLTRLEARPARRVRKPAARKPRQPK